jgi:hypothetical protein
MRARVPGRRSPSRYPETAAAIRARLDEYGGAIVGDEVGAGKTFVTFALIAEAVLRDDSRGAVIARGDAAVIVRGFEPESPGRLSLRAQGGLRPRPTPSLHADVDRLDGGSRRARSGSSGSRVSQGDRCAAG